MNSKMIRWREIIFVIVKIKAKASCAEWMEIHFICIVKIGKLSRQQNKFSHFKNCLLFFHLHEHFTCQIGFHFTFWNFYSHIEWEKVLIVATWMHEFMIHLMWMWLYSMMFDDLKIYCVLYKCKSFSGFWFRFSVSQY